MVGRIVAAAGLSGRETVVEIGAGLGVLTERLQRVAGRLIAVEVDTELCSYLRTKFAAAANIEVIEADALKFEADALGLESHGYGVIGNLPFNIGTAVLRHLLESRRPPAWLVVMLQKEVGEALCASPGELSLVGVAVQVYAEARPLFEVAPDAFFPPPKVRSAVVRLDVRPEPFVPADELPRFFQVARAGFNAPRKQLRNSLAQGLAVPVAQAQVWIDAAGIDRRLRPEALRLEDWARLARAVDR